PDSTVIYESGGIFSHNWLHGVGMAFDPYSIIFDSNLLAPIVPPNATYTIDSVFILGWYRKEIAATDTLLVELVHGIAQEDPIFDNIQFSSNSHQISPPYLTSNSTQYGAQAFLTPTSKTVIKYPLTNADSTLNFGKYITVPVGLSVPANEIVGIHMAFIPGYSYSFGDSLFSYSAATGNPAIANPQMNSMRVGFYGVKDAALTPLYFADDPIFGFNLSHYVHVDTRYQLWTSPAFLNDIMYPTANWGFDIGFYVNNVQIGIDEPAANNANIYPNPSTGTVTIELSSANKATVDVYGIAGNLVYTQELNDLNTTINLDVEKGYYIVKVTQNGQVSSQKLLVQ
ncbi:MAG: T9SS type A sorting domain-containing protein, partial [Bacteroidales bacterium]|nr:T9SS type A sorting domain-containing protein [Bacteroidales bacterium]